MKAAAAATAKAEAQAKLPEKPRLARLKTSHDSFSSMPATSPPASDDGAPEAKAKAALEPLPEPVASKEPKFAKLRVALSRAAEIAKDAPFAKPPPMSPRTLRRAETALWKLGCFCGGFLGVLVLSSVNGADQADCAQEDAQAGARREGADGDGDGGFEAPRRPHGRRVASNLERSLLSLTRVRAIRVAMRCDGMGCVRDDALVCTVLISRNIMRGDGYSSGASLRA